MASEYEALRAKSQEALIGFLRAELDLGFTLVQSALLAMDQDHTDHYAQAKRDATAAAEAVQRFIGQVEDPGGRGRIQRAAFGT